MERPSTPRGRPQVLWQLLHARDLTEQRTRVKGMATWGDAPLCIADVPMLLRQVRRAAHLGAAAASPEGGDGRVDGSDVYEAPAALPADVFSPMRARWKRLAAGMRTSIAVSGENSFVWRSGKANVPPAVSQAWPAAAAIGAEAHRDRA